MFLYFKRLCNHPQLAVIINCHLVGVIKPFSPFFSRDSVMEILFEQDNEEKSVATLILDTLVKVKTSFSFSHSNVYR